LTRRHLDTNGSQVIFQDRKVNLLTSPVGIDPSEFHKLLDRSDVKQRVQDLEEKYKGVQLMISVDRLDYIKGIPLRIDAMDAFLTKYPNYADKIVLLQVVIPSREEVKDYRGLHDQINQAVSRVNEKHGPVDMTPIHSLFSAVSKAELAALYAVSDVCIVSSIRDGFNMVSLEYVACQRERHGVLLLSEFAGASEVLDESVSINPWGTDEFADAIHCALTMGKEEKKARWESLNKRVEQFTSKRWGEAFLESLKNSDHGHTARDGVALE
jgi:trehalose 6-phosphate synthase